MRHTLEKQKRQINELTSQNNAAEQQIKQISERKVQPGVSGLKQSKIKSFVSTQIRDSLNLDSSDKEENNGAWKPDSTQQGATGSDAGSGRLAAMQDRATFLVLVWCTRSLNIST